MATAKQYALALWDIQAVTAEKLGTDIRSASMQLRAGLLAMDITLAVVLKILVDNGALTDVQLTAGANAIKASAFPPLDPDPQAPGDGSPIPPPNLG